MIDSIFDEAMEAATAVLEKTRQELEGLTCPAPRGPFLLHVRDLGTQKEEELLDLLPSGHAKVDHDADHVYVFGIAAPNAELFAGVCKKFESARSANSEKAAAFCRAIKEHASPGALYVGRSKHLRARIAQHLDGKNGGTYAMHLGHWAKELDFELTLSFITLTGRSDTLVQAVEDGLWTALRPALGKRGAR